MLTPSGQHFVDLPRWKRVTDMAEKAKKAKKAKKSKKGKK